MKTNHSIFALAFAVILFASCSQPAKNESAMKPQALVGGSDSTGFERLIDSNEVMCYDVFQDDAGKVFLLGIDHSQKVPDKVNAFAVNYSNNEGKFFYHSGETTWASPDSIAEKELTVKYETVANGNLSLDKGILYRKGLPICPLSAMITLTQDGGNTIIGYIEQSEVTK